jgi:hypothetical protein
MLSEKAPFHLAKLDDTEARPVEDDDILNKLTRSVASGRTMEQIAKNTKAADTSSRQARRSRKPSTQGIREDNEPTEITRALPITQFPCGLTNGILIRSFS